MICFACGWFPVWVRVVDDDTMPKRTFSDGTPALVLGVSVRLGYVKIARSHAGNIGIIAHEMRHQRQALMRPFAHARDYTRDEGYRLQSEVDAFRAQLACYTDYIDERIEAYAWLIANGYGIDVSSLVVRYFLKGGES